MLNTESRLVSLVVWLAVACIVLQFLWTFFAWPPLHVMVRAALDSEVAAIAGRNQTLIGTLGGLGGLAVAYVLNGWRNRTEARHAIERREKRLASVLAREAEEIAAACEQAARQLAGRNAAPARAALAPAVAPAATVLLSAAMADIAVLGAGAAAAVRKLRAATARLGVTLDGTRDDGPAARSAALEAMEAAAAAHDAARVLTVVAVHGPLAGDRVLSVPAPAAADLEAALGLAADTAAPRLLPAA